MHMWPLALAQQYFHLPCAASCVASFSSQPSHLRLLRTVGTIAIVPQVTQHNGTQLNLTASPAAAIAQPLRVDRVQAVQAARELRGDHVHNPRMYMYEARMFRY